MALLGLSLTGCGTFSPLGTPEGDAQTAGLLAPKLPADRVLAPAERQGDFDRYLLIARQDALAWSPNALLTGAQATNVDALGGKAGGTTYVYSFVSGRNGLSVTVAGQAVTYAKAKAGTPMETRDLLPAAKAMTAALANGALAAESYVLALGTSKVGPVYVVQEFKREGAASVMIDARSGQRLQ
jgi:hypothetical protein